MRILIVRIGALGDALIITPLVRYLKEEGNEIYLMGSKSTEIIFKHNPYVDKFLFYKKDSIPTEFLGRFIEETAKAYECDKIIDLSGSIENKLLFHPLQPQYNFPKEERIKLANKNFYDWTFEVAGYPNIKGQLPEMYFSDDEEEWCAKFRQDYLGKKIILWGLSGSARHKAYPYTRLVMEDIIMRYNNVIFITVGDEYCQILEVELEHERVIHKSGKWNFRQSAIMCKYASLVIAPETGLIHAAGCFNTPKICLYSHSTRVSLSRYFVNDYSIEPDVSCAPCFRLIYDADIQCPIDDLTKAPYCMAFGISPRKLITRIEEVINGTGEVSYLQKRSNL